jgi:hypothetical protein
LTRTRRRITGIVNVGSDWLSVPVKYLLAVLGGNVTIDYWSEL